MADNLKERFSALSERLKVGRAEVGRKMSARMISVSGKMKELFQVPTQADRLVEDLTAENLEGLDWAKSLELCDSVNREKISGQDTVKAIKKRLVLKNARVQFLALTLLETCVKNCEKMFSEVASERVLDEMVKLIDDRQTPVVNRDKALKLIEAWGESTEQLRYLPVYEETYKSMKSRGVEFPGRDPESLAPIFTPPQSVTMPTANNGMPGDHSGELPGAHGEAMGFSQANDVFEIARNSVELLSTVLTSSPQQEALNDELTVSLVEQCRQLQFSVQRIVERAGENEPLLFEALNVNDEVQKVLTKYEEMLTSFASQPSQPSGSTEPALMPVNTVSEGDLASGGTEIGLVRSRSSMASHRSPGANTAADLDQMTSGEASSINAKKKSDDLILF